jgi:hypothetical protein
MRRLSPTLLALLLGVVILLLLVAYFASVRSSEQDKLKSSEIASTISPRPVALEKRCASQAAYDLIKRQLFQRAAQLRRSDQAAYEKLADFAVVRMENPVVESDDSGAVNCSGSLSLDLPPGVAVAGGRSTLMSDVDFTVDANGEVSLRNADTLISQLATLTRVAPPPQPVQSLEGNAIAPESPEANISASESANVRPGPPSAYPGRPSFDCANARTRGEIAVCQDGGLSALDLNMTTQYRRALAGASPGEQAVLQQTARRFYAYRDRCPNRQCIADAYLGRMREIRDIMEGRWQPR